MLTVLLERGCADWDTHGVSGEGMQGTVLIVLCVCGP